MEKKNNFPEVKQVFLFYFILFSNKAQKNGNTISYTLLSKC